MQHEVPQVISRLFFMSLVISLVVANARPSHFGETNQILPDQETNNMADPGLKPWQMELLLAQKLAELNQINQAGGSDYGFERALRSGNEIKRQSRYRLCYFNPVSCFKK